MERPRENPMGTDGLAFVEFSALDPAPLEALFDRLGFAKTAVHRARPVSLWRQGDIEILLNGDAGTFGGRFAALHGPCVSSIAFNVADGPKSARLALKWGATAHDANAVKTIDAPAIEGIGASLLYLVDRDAAAAMREAFRPVPAARVRRDGPQFATIDHLTHNVRPGRLEHWVDFYRRLFGFREIFYLDTKGAASGFRTRAMMSACDKICIPVNEPTDPKSQIQEFIDLYNGEGVQHIALASEDICVDVENVIARGVPFMDIPPTYYEDVDKRLPKHGQDLARLRKSGILIDGERNATTGKWELLLQIFSKNLVGPIFFEIIQRKGNQGFGEGNAKALFDAIERDQIKRGVFQEHLSPGG